MEFTILNDGKIQIWKNFLDIIRKFSLESFKDFIVDDFDIKSFSANILQTKIVTDYLQHLNELIRTLDAEIKQQVKKKFILK
jgi:hypothetical protein